MLDNSYSRQEITHDETDLGMFSVDTVQTHPDVKTHNEVLPPNVPKRILDPLALLAPSSLSIEPKMLQTTSH